MLNIVGPTMKTKPRNTKKSLPLMSLMNLMPRLMPAQLEAVYIAIISSDIAPHESLVDGMPNCESRPLATWSTPSPSDVTMPPASENIINASSICPQKPFIFSPKMGIKAELIVRGAFML